MKDKPLTKDKPRYGAIRLDSLRPHAVLNNDEGWQPHKRSADRILGPEPRPPLMNFEGDVECALGFFTAKPEFYPNFDRLCRQRVAEAFPEPQSEDDEQE